MTNKIAVLSCSCSYKVYLYMFVRLKIIFLSGCEILAIYYVLNKLNTYGNGNVYKLLFDVSYGSNNKT